MDTRQKPKLIERTPDSDADLNLFLYKSGASFKNLLVAMGRGIRNAGVGLLLSILFMFRNVWWLLLGAIAGLGYGLYVLSSEGPKYSSEMTVKANFGSVQALYTTIDYFNALIRDSKSEELAKIFNLTAKQASNIRGFSASPLKSELETARMYNDRFRGRTALADMLPDTFWVHTIKYDKFKESLTDVDYPVHVFKVKSSNPEVFTAIEKGLVSQISKIELLQSAKQLHNSISRSEEQLLASSINNLDSLRRAYNERLVRGPGQTPASNQLMLVENSQNMKAPELQLYDKMLQLKDELNQVRTRAITEQDIIEVLSPLNPAGKKESVFESVWRYILAGLLTVLAILVLLSIRQGLIAYEKRLRKRKAANEHSALI